MTPDEFQRIVTQDPSLCDTLARAARAAAPKQFSVITEAALVALMFPIVKYVLVHVGLPWLLELKRYSEVHRQKFHAWIDRRYREEGLDPDAAEAAGDALCRELEATTAADARAAWERMALLLRDES